MGKKKNKKDNKFKNNGLLYTEINNNGDSKCISICHKIYDDIFDKVLTFSSDAKGRSISFKKKNFKDLFNSYEDTILPSLYESLYTHGGLIELSKIYEKIESMKGSCKEEYIKKHKKDSIFQIIQEIIEFIISYIYNDSAVASKGLIRKTIIAQADNYMHIIKRNKSLGWTEVIDVTSWFHSVFMAIK